MNQAHRWMMLNEHPRLDTAVRFTLATTYDLPREVTPEWLYGMGTQVAACDWICEEIAVYHFGGLADFLDVKATPELLSSRRPRVRRLPRRSRRRSQPDDDALGAAGRSG